MFFICIHNGLQAILEKCRQQLGKCVNHRGHTEFVGALFGRTICDHPLKSLLIYCGCLFSEIPGLSLGTASILISQLGLSKRESNLQNEAMQQIKHGNVRIYWDRNRGGSRQILHWIHGSSDMLAFDMRFLLWGRVKLLWRCLRYTYLWTDILHCVRNADSCSGYFHHYFYKGSLAVPVQAIASLADYEPDNLPQPIRIPLSELPRLSQAQLRVQFKHFPCV